MAIVTEKESHLQRLSDLTDYEVSDHDPDIRGWSVLGKDREFLGTVDELIIDPDEMRVRYIDVKIEQDIKGQKGRHVLVPVGIAALDESEDVVLLKDYTIDSLANYPEYKGQPLNQEFESDLLRYLDPQAPQLTNQESYLYEHEYFNEKPFFRNRRMKGRPLDTEETPEQRAIRKKDLS